MRKETASKAGLDAYRDKRDPARTPEPFAAERIRSGATLRGTFVVHQHGARRMHYDLRLQVGGALKSFAVPHGPTLDPREKRLAVNTEDHPIEYLDFEDVIPAGNYGAGPMIVWDTGAVTYLEGSAEEGIARGKLDFQLSGHKLRGRFALIHTGARAKPGATERNQWLLVKKQDSHARAGAIDEPFSVLSGLKLEELAGAAELARSLEEEAARLGAKRGEVDTRDFTPMLCSNEGAELDEGDRLYELKLDGVRIIADRHHNDVELRYRKQRSASAAYPEIARAVRALPGTRLVLDGEVVAFDERGRPSFQRLARRIHLWQPLDVRRAAAEVPVTYMVFDLLQLGAYDLRSLPLRERKKLLLALVRGRGLVRVLDHLEGDGRALYAFCREHELEGVVGKRMEAPYRPGPKRTNDWVKIKRQREADFVVAGWEESQKARKLRSLVLATYDGDRLVLRGKVGSGLDDATIDWFLARLAKSETRQRIAEGTVTSHGKRHWVHPELVVNVEYAGFSDSGVLRFPVYRGLREDMDPRDCRLAPPTEEVIEDSLEQGPAPEAHAGLVAASDVAVRAQLSNQDKVFWPDEGYTKGDLCNYYASVAEALLPFLKGRPIVMVRYPDGIVGKNFYQWHVPKGTPDWLRSLEVREEGERGKNAKRTFLIDDIDGLLHIANLGCIPVHVLACHENSRHQCDFLTIDFDIGEQPFRHAVTLALGLRELCDELGLKSYPKTSGQTGLHVLVPLGPGVRFETAKMLTELLGRILWARHRDIATMERRTDKRGEHVLIDVGQTGRSRTIVSPYSVRAIPGALVSAPLRWEEVHQALDPSRFTMFTVPARLASLGCPMADLLQVRPDVAGAVIKIEKKLGGAR